MLRVLLTGDYAGEEFTAAVAEMKLVCELIERPCLKSAATWLAESEKPVDLIVVAQSRPGQFGAAAIDALRRAAPLAPLVALLGSWCEGEMRSGSPWPGVARVYWHQWPGRFQREMARLARGELSAWNQPLTATADERLLSSLTGTGAPLSGVLAVVSDFSEMRDWLADTCRRAGNSPVVFRRPPGEPLERFDLVLWDAGLPPSDLVADYSQLAACFAGTPIVALLDFLRSHDVRQLTTSGAAAVLGKPVLAEDLMGAIGRALGAKEPSS
ncbi:MAG TPA: response regulator [Pirellulales bacterium]|nr:response regulator [Pirellulales bacterium]